MFITLPALAAPWRLKADLLEYFPQEDRAQAQGAVLLQWDDFKLAAQSANLFFGEEKAELTRAQGQGAGLYFQAEEVLKLPLGTDLFQAKLTGCSLLEPEYLFFSKHVHLTEDRVYLHGNSLRLFWLPKIPLPALSFPRNTQLPLPTPRVGSSQSRGYWGGLALPNLLGRNRAGTFTVLASAKKGLILSQELKYTPGPWNANFALRWEDGIWGGVQINRGVWRLVAERETRSPVEDQPLVVLPELSYTAQRDLRGLSLNQNFSAGSLKEGSVASTRLRSQSILAGKWNLGKMTLNFGGIFIASRYDQERLLALSLTSSLGRSWQLGETLFAASVGGSVRKVEGASPFRHDAVISGADLTFGGSLKRGAWQLTFAKEGTLYEIPHWQLSLRRDGHCFYWQLGYDDRNRAVGLKMGLR